jgi:hypothetical protein
MPEPAQPIQAATIYRPSVERCSAVLVHGPTGIVCHLPRVAVGIDEDARIPAPERCRSRAGDGAPAAARASARLAALLRAADAVGERHAARAAAVRDPAVPGELPTLPQRQDEPRSLEKATWSVWSSTHSPGAIRAPHRTPGSARRCARRGSRVIGLSSWSVAVSLGTSPSALGCDTGSGAWSDHSEWLRAWRASTMARPPLLARCPAGLAKHLAIRSLQQPGPGLNRLDDQPDPTCGDASREHQSDRWCLTSNP